ncbi:MAG: transketolase, partial [Candidatus Melainabacteria bacterium HGW-Melainabacteria-1]
DQKVYVLLGDGEINEGQVWEAAMLAGSLKLDNLIAIVDRNKIQQSNFSDAIVDSEPLDAKFRAFGWDVARINGHDFEAIAGAFDQVHASSGKPFVIVADTEKGYGVSFLSGQLKKHGVALKADEKEKAYAELPVAADLDIASLIQSKQSFGAYAKPAAIKLEATLPADFDASKPQAPRAAYGDALKALGAQNERIWVIDGDVSNSTFSERFAQAHPARHIECGIAEQNMVSVGVGVSATGKVAVVNSFARFFERAYDQIEMGAYSQANLKVVGSHIGVSIGEDGASQMAMADCGFFRALPGAVVICPADYVSAYKLTATILEHEGFCYMRNVRGNVPVLYSADETFPLGDYKVLKSSDADQAIVLASGVTVPEALSAAEQLAAEGIAVRVIDAYSLKPFPSERLLQECQGLGTRHVFTIEDHYPVGGLGDAALEALNGSGVKVEKLAVTEYPESGSTAALMAKYGIDAAALKARVLSVLK